MAWVRMDDCWDEHPKCVKAGPLAMAVQKRSLAYANRNTTDGFIPSAIAKRISWEVSEDAARHLGISADEWLRLDAASELTERLVEAGIWYVVDDGFLIHDYLDFQPSKADLEERSDAKKAAGRKGGLAKAKQASSKSQAEAKQTSSKTEAKLKPVPVPVPEPVTTPKGVVNGARTISAKELRNRKRLGLDAIGGQQ